ncbi:methylthioribose-1-phosphate isomerase-like isoform X2 [Dendronephthya gigantea]|uniref:methylthioribose-1-phosphate isomerase-like isoform X2 n=1 Tax=Dendronephthya gigantea TaxID=151771 RepID=UPI001068D73F|nr:methylthioribose-1-phosphate isomerase-like isoform X2 [Dendronephthya gigantea]
MSLEAIRYKPGHLEILNQLLLPHQTIYETVKNTEDGWQAIRQMKVRGAPAIAIVGSLSLAVELATKCFDSKDSLIDWVVARLDYLVTARPTAVNMAIASAKLKKFVKLDKYAGTTTEEMKCCLIAEIESMLAKDIADNKAIGSHGANHMMANIKAEKIVAMTHCNTGSLATAGYGTALGVVRALHETGALEHVYCTETRPYNQGSRLTAYELVHDHIPSTLIADSMVSIALKEKKVSAIVVGADRVAANGDTANKIGTYQLAISAKYHKVPFYIAAPSTSVDLACKSGSDIIIEERPQKELTHLKGQPIAAAGIDCWNPAFDVTPADLITGGIVTEFGVFKPSELQGKIKKNLSNG